jgi:hypothetical protein
MSKWLKISVVAAVILYLAAAGFLWSGYSKLECSATAWPHREIHVSAIMFRAGIGALFLLVAGALTGYLAGIGIASLLANVRAESKKGGAEPD